MKFKRHPPANRDWAPEFSRLPWSERTGEVVTLHQVRNFDYRTEKDFNARWETRCYDLGTIIGVDLFLTHWGAPLVAKAKIGGISRWNWRTLLDGSGDKMLYDLHDLADGGLSFKALKAQALINPAA